VQLSIISPACPRPRSSPLARARRPNPLASSSAVAVAADACSILILLRHPPPLITAAPPPPPPPPPPPLRMATSSIKFRFANARDSDAVLFEGQQILASVLRRAIAEKRDLVQLGPDGIALFDEQGNGACARARAPRSARELAPRRDRLRSRDRVHSTRAYERMRTRPPPRPPRRLTALVPSTLSYAEIGAEAFVHKNSTVVVRMRAARSCLLYTSPSPRD
jgi:hypothetical protein